MVRLQVERTPDAVACVDEFTTLSYRELDVLSDVLANRITTATAGQRGAAVVCVPRGVGLTVALLGVLKAGCWYMPVSQDEPAARVAAMAGDAAPVVVVTAGAPPPERVRRLPAVCVPAQVPKGHDPLPLPEFDSDHPVYVLFTSGSTGSPKGVLLGSGALCNRLLWMQRQYGLTPADAVLQKTPVTFDVSGWEFFWPLIVGARSVHVPEEAARDPMMIADLIRDKGITVCHFVPSMLEEFVRNADQHAINKLRAVFCSGEALPPGLAARFVRTFDADLHNLYGPTEAAIDVTHWSVPASFDAADTVYIGQPVDNTVLLAVGAEGCPAPEGELWIAGAQLAMEYVNRPEATAAAFIKRFGSRWYRTGDFVRVVGDRIEYLGRMDDQVKVRGVRVEPAEVEAVLCRHPAVASAVVVAIPAAHMAGYELVAALTSAEGKPALNNDLSGFVSAELPPAFVPSGFCWLDKLPLTPNGKADRRSVRELLATWWRGRTNLPNVDPIARIWWEALRYPESGEAEALRFVDLGGHSLIAARLIGRVARELGVRVPFSLLLRDNASLSEFRGYITNAAPEPSAVRPTAPRVSLQIPLGPGQQRLWMLHSIDPLSVDYNVVAAVRFIGNVSPSALRTALVRLVERHDALRSRVRVDGDGTPWLKVDEVALPWLEVRSTPNLDDNTVNAFVREYARRPISMSEAPMMVAGLLQSSTDDEACFVLCQHHLIADQHSVDLLMAELAHAYAAEMDGREPDLEPAPSYVEYASADHSVDMKRFAYWRTVLADAPNELVLPAIEGRSGTRVRQVLAAEVVDNFVRARSATPAGLVLAVLATVLSAWSGQTTVVIGMPATRRLSPDEQRMAGFLVDTLPVRVDLPNAATFAEVLEHVHRRYVDALDHAVAEFDELVDQLRIPRRPGVNPVFQVWFNDLSRVAAPPSVPGLRAESVDVDTGQTLFDLNFYLRRTKAGYALDLVPRAGRMASNVAAEMLDQCVRVVNQIVVQSEIPLAELDLRTTRPLAKPAGAHRLDASITDVVAQVLREAGARPEATAFIAGPGQELTYSWLANEVRLLVDELSANGVRPGFVVEVRSTRSAWLAPVLLAIWRLGGVAAMTDMDWPAQRLAVQSAALRPAVSVVVPSDPRHRPVIDAVAGTHRVLPGASHILFTSGTTTGAPAAVVVPQTALAAAMAWYRTEFTPTERDRVTLLSAPAHDPVLRDLLGALVVGGTVLVPQPGVVADPLRLLEFIDDSAPTIMHVTPALIEMLLAAHDERPLLHLPTLRLVICGGAPLSSALVRRLRMLTDAAVVNAYGATETPQIVARHWILGVGEPVGELGERDSLPIGTSVGGAGIEVVTATGRPAAVGQLGEIVVTGEQLASGYLDDTEPERLVAGQSFRTGDLGRIDLAGVIHLAGRNDRQVSINGFRVHLDEIESAAVAHEGVTAARAVRHLVDEHETLALQVVGNSSLDPKIVRQHLRSMLPSAAVPTRIDVVTHLGAAINRKESRQLPVPPNLERVLSARDVEPVLRAELSRMVGRDLDAQENFFDAGLNSISLIRLHHALGHRFGPFPVTSLFEHPNIAAMTGFLAGTTVSAVLAMRSASGAPARPLALAVSRRAVRRGITEWALGEA
ncbi:non-ribosomal peptide synthetase [Kibdelosporangium aridum]|uniref:non-ribosomal peptide synthetase n=1 Tax=Kibdelosporangium aridum TaxID=2030 RepID=UPI000526A57E